MKTKRILGALAATPSPQFMLHRLVELDRKPAHPAAEHEYRWESLHASMRLKPFLFLNFDPNGFEDLLPCP